MIKRAPYLLFVAFILNACVTTASPSEGGGEEASAEAGQEKSDGEDGKKPQKAKNKPGKEVAASKKDKNEAEDDKSEKAVKETEQSSAVAGGGAEASKAKTEAGSAEKPQACQCPPPTAKDCAALRGEDDYAAPEAIGAMSKPEDDEAIDSELKIIETGPASEDEEPSEEKHDLNKPDVRSELPNSMKDQQDEDEVREGIYYVTVNGLNVRQGPSMQSAVVGSLAKGAPVKSLSREGIWVRIGEEQYVSIKYLTENPGK